MIITKKLDCGATMVTEKNEDMQAACIGIWVGAGAAYETPEISGISHYIEHMFFKGTKNRTAKQIAEDMDNYGAQFNAFTGKEGTCFHAKALTQTFPQTVEVLLDMMKNSLFDPVEMNKERGVILEEMSMIEDTPDDYVVDLITECTMDGTDIANSIIGSRTTVKKINQKNILDYIDAQYTRDHMVISVVGNFDENQLENQLNEYLSGFRESKPKRAYKQPSGVRKFANRAKDINQTHIALGIPTISIADDQYYAQAIVNDILGGSMSSRLFQNIREERGLAYTVYSSNQSFAGNGMFYIYAGLSLGKEKEAIDAIAYELDVLGKEKITKEVLETEKQRLKSAYVFGLETMNSRMYRNGKNLLLIGKTYTEADTMAEIDAVTVDEVNDFCQRLCDITKYSGASISKNRLDIKKLIG